MALLEGVGSSEIAGFGIGTSSRIDLSSNQQSTITMLALHEL
jgi:hypothetical protein